MSLFGSFAPGIKTTAQNTAVSACNADAAISDALGLRKDLQRGGRAF
jgi:hypothetical protein